jgi:pimeloyl-ACP methyl ester carboxylesterase
MTLLRDRTDFEHGRIDVGDLFLHVATTGSGPPVVLLHGFPQTHECWRHVAPRLAERYTVVCPDLRGYGGSEGPPSDGRATYSKRAMARDVRRLMHALGHERFSVVGHDRGGLVAYRLALDAPDAVERVAALSVVPALELWEAVDAAGALSGFHLLLLAQPPDLPEQLLAARPDAFLDRFLDARCATPGALDDARAAYARALASPGAIHAICEDHRAGLAADVEHDRADRDRGRRIGAPLLALWEERHGSELPFDPLEAWSRWADDVRGEALGCGHFLPEERPQEVARALDAFLSDRYAAAER